MYAELTENKITWGLGWIGEVTFEDWTNKHILLDRVDVGHRRRYSRRVVGVNRECVIS